jgi:hypothetical protein
LTLLVATGILTVVPVTVRGDVNVYSAGPPNCVKDAAGTAAVATKDALLYTVPLRISQASPAALGRLLDVRVYAVPIPEATYSPFWEAVVWLPRITRSPF